MTTTSPFTVDSATSALNANLAQTTGKKNTGTQNLGQSDFLALLTAQLQFQDPFNPTDNTQMVAQLAQFSQLTSQNDANVKLQSIVDALSGSRLSDAASWIGKSALVKSGTVAPDAAGQYAGQLQLAKDSGAVSVDLVDSSGNVVKTLDLGAQNAGDVPFYWNGKDESGNQVSTGPLRINVRGATVSETDAWTTIAAVRSPASGAGATLITTLGNFSPSDALSLG